LRTVDAAKLFLVALDDERTSFRYHHLVRQLLRAELRARDRTRQQALELRAAEWFQATGDSRRASRHFLAARQADRALALLEDRVVTEFLRDPAQPPPLDLSMVDPALLLARVALASGEYDAARERLQALPLGDLTPRRALERQILLAAAAIGRGDPMTASVLAGVLDTARREGFLNTVVTTAPQVTGYLAGHSAQLRPDPFTEQLISAALEVRAVSPEASRPGRALIEPLTEAELRILKLLPTSTYLQMAATLYISRNTVKTHLGSIYHKLGVASRSEAIQRAVDLRLL
jgi:DNA-binding CsgD family transcriptional regulator